MPGWEGLYSLNWRQAECYGDLFDFYPIVEGATTADKEAGSPQWADTPAYSGVPGRLKRTPDFEMQSPLGQISETNIMTEDNISVHAKQPCSTNWGIVLRTILQDGSRHPDYGKWWNVEGLPKVTPTYGVRETDNQVIYAKEGDPPANVTGLT